MITQETASAMARLYRELSGAEQFLAEIDAELKKEPERIDHHGEPVHAIRNCQLGWPQGLSESWRVYQVEPRIARAVVVAHIADQKAKLEKLNEVASLEARS